MPRQNIIKQSTHRYLEINDPEKAVGLWSHFQQRTTTLIPVQDTKRALGRFLNEDIARHDCWDQMKAALLAKNVEGEKRKTEARKLAEYEEEFRQKGGLPPKWLVLWRRFGSRLENKYEFVDKPKDVQMFFTLEAPIVIGDEFKEMVAREFRRVIATGTMSYQQQLVRPSHEVALGIWLARLP